MVSNSRKPVEVNMRPVVQGFVPGNGVFFDDNELVTENEVLEDVGWSDGITEVLPRDAVRRLNVDAIVSSIFFSVAVQCYSLYHNKRSYSSTTGTSGGSGIVVVGEKVD